MEGFLKEWLTFPTIKDVVLFGLAIYGALLSTFNWRQAAQKNKRSINVSISTAMPTYANGTIGQCFAKVEAVNDGHRTVTVSTLTLELESGGRFFPTTSNAFPGIPDSPLPAILSDGQTAHLFLSYQQIADALINNGHRQKTKVRPVCVDTVGGVYKGKPWEVDPVEFSRM